MARFFFARLWFVLLGGAILAAPLPVTGAPASRPTARGPMGPLDLSTAVIVSPPDAPAPARKAVEVLVDEIARRTSVRLAVTATWPRDRPVIAVGPASAVRTFTGPFAERLLAEKGDRPADGFRLRVERQGSQAAVLLVGHDARGVLFAVGRLLRALELGPRRVVLPVALNVYTAPEVAVRGHRFVTGGASTSYDQWTPAMWERQVRELTWFGANMLEVDAPGGAAGREVETTLALARIGASYGLNLFLRTAPTATELTEAAAEAAWTALLDKLPRLTALVVAPGPDVVSAERLLANAERLATLFRKRNAKGQVWILPQAFPRTESDRLLELLAKEPAWLDGYVFGPEDAHTPRSLRRRLPGRYQWRLEADVTRSVPGQHPRFDWDVALAATEGLLVSNPRPLGIGDHYRSLEKRSTGFTLVSVGAHDDLNKVLWTALGWDAMADTTELLRQYTRLLVGPGIDETFAQALLALERNWRGPLAVNTGVAMTLRQLETIERSAPQATRTAWRFQLALFRGYLDAYVQSRLNAVRRREDEARARLREAPSQGSLRAMDAAEGALSADDGPVAPDWRARLLQLADALHASIKLQLSVARHGAASVAGGAVLDSMDAPLGDGPWLRRRFADIRQLPTEARRLEAIEAVLGRTDPGPGGRYDDLGNVSAQPHLLRGLDLDEDDAFEEVGLLGFAWRSPAIGGAPADSLVASPDAPAASWDCAGSRGGFPLELRYTGLDGAARYRVRVAYAAGAKRRIRLLGDERPLHAFLDTPTQPVEVDVPEELTRDGTLRLSWLDGPESPTGCQVAEVWLLRR